MDHISEIAYLLFIIPGFVLVWAFRHFAGKNEITDFEYAGWSFVWGTLEFIVFVAVASFSSYKGPEINPNDPMSLLASFTGMGLAIALVMSFPLGYFIAYVSRSGMFRDVDVFLKGLISK